MSDWRYVLNPDTHAYAAGFDRHKTYEFKHHRGEAFVAKMTDMHPAFNVWGLMFREPPNLP